MSAIDGYDVCIFAYGQTGSGKTYTMEGASTGMNQGIIPRTIDSVFEIIKQKENNGWKFRLEWSIQEIYLDQINDLLDSKNSMKQLNKSTNYEPTVIEITKPEDLHLLVEKARENRVVECNQLNERSSRSHSIFQLIIKSNSQSPDGKSMHNHGSVNLIDLAGSERLHKNTNASEKVLNESRAINKSLSHLRDVIRAIATKETHVPYRNSKLTWLLKNHLGSSGAKTLMIVNVSPLLAHVNETINSLRFASEVNTWTL